MANVLVQIDMKTHTLETALVEISRKNRHNSK